MDRLDVYSKEGKGTLVVMTKRLGQGREDEDGAAGKE